jgi:exonuclease III
MFDKMAGNNINEKRNTNKSGLSILSWNMNGMRSDVKFNELQNYLDNTKSPIDIICIQETKLIKQQKPFKLKGYQKAVYSNRPNTNHAGARYVYMLKMT